MDKAHRHSLTAVHAQKGVAHRVSVGVADRQGVPARCDSTNTIELERTRVVAYVAYLLSTGARRAARIKALPSSVLSFDSASYDVHDSGVGLGHSVAVGLGVAVAVGVGV